MIWITLFTLFFHTLSAISFDTLEKKMTSSEKKKTGIYKLTKKERQFLQKWFKNYKKKTHHRTLSVVSDEKDITWAYETVSLPYKNKKNCLRLFVSKNSVSIAEQITEAQKKGISRFHIYNTGISDREFESIIPFIASGSVDFIEWPIEKRVPKGV